MICRLLIILGLSLIAGCTARTPLPEVPLEPELVPEVIEPVAEAPPEPEQPEEIVPDTCELLLMSLEETKPLLSNLDESLASQADRLEAVVERLNRPAPEPRVQECPAEGPTVGSKEIIGAIEWLYMDPPGNHYRARVDSGAETSSLSASDIVEFERDGDDWVRFTFEHDSSEEAVNLELPIKRTVLVRQVSADEPERRFVVEIDIRLGQQLQATEFTLTDRSRMTYPVLLGRAFLMDLYVVDVSRSFTHDKYEASD